ncbi:Replication protein A 70 kDa DNA-binding subunit [Symbiodinium microadriaticum]|uniref:Replication protein A 70 kDa DNA-binding subunit n=1 Tax=Symbiodinium microadriaticum TaxID=2951 RepID=A0A1Q9DUM2_SYMMI|nr:Replication protein A 70 kDa DNA-binding subunit [Symbiodinium microadriaticum]
MDAGKVTAEQRARIQLKREQALARRSARRAVSAGEGAAKLTVEQRERAQRSREGALARKAAKLTATRLDGSCQSWAAPSPGNPANIALTEDQTSTDATAPSTTNAANATLTKHLTTSDATVPAAVANRDSITLIKDLTTTGARARAWSLKVEVVRKDQELKSTRDGGKWFSAQLRDKTGEVRAAFFQQAAVEGFEELEQGHVFQISGGVAKAAASPNSGVQLTFNRLTLNAAAFSTEELEDPIAWTFVTFGLSVGQIFEGQVAEGTLVNVRGTVLEEEEQRVLELGTREAKCRRATLLGEDGETIHIDFWGEASEASYKNADILCLGNVKVRGGRDNDIDYMLTTVSSTRIRTLEKGTTSATAELHRELCRHMEDARHRLSEVKLRKEELAARRAARQAARLREKKRLEQLQGMQKEDH